MIAMMLLLLLLLLLVKFFCINFVLEYLYVPDEWLILLSYI